jgi:PAS domain S-box-containing protein
MSWHFNLYSIPLFIGVFILLGIAFLALRRHSAPGAIYLFWLSVSIIFYVFGYALEIGSRTLPQVLFFMKVEYLGIATFSIPLLAMTLAITGYDDWNRPLYFVVALIVPAIIFGLALTNQRHGLIWENPHLVPFQDMLLADFTPGAWYWVNVAYYEALMLATVFLLVRAFLRASDLYRRQFAVLLAGVLLPFAFNIIYIFVLPPEFNLDIQPYGLTLASVVMAWGLFSYGIFDIMPAAREVVLASMMDAVIVLDVQDRIVDLNPAARRLLGPSQTNLIGRSAAQAFDRWPELVEMFRYVQTAHAEMMIPVEGKERDFDIRLSTLRDPRAQPVGRVIVLHDITVRKQAEEALRVTNKRLTTLRQVDAELSRKLDVQYVTNMALDAALRLSLADAGFLALADEEGIRVVHALGHFTEQARGRLLPPGTGITSRVIRTGEAAFVPDVSQDPDYYPIVADTRAQITVPLQFGSDFIGVLTLETKDPGRFTQDVFESIKMLAGRIAIAIDNANIYEEREHLVEELEAFAHTVAHDLKNPLNLVIGFGELLSDAYPELTVEERFEYIHQMQSGAEKAVDIVDALLLLAGVRTLDTVRIGPLDTGSIVEEVLNRMEPVIEEYGATVAMPEDWPVVKGYAPWVEEIWVNYLSNALKYGGRPPHVELGSEETPNGDVRFWVQDNGQGLTPSEQAKLFRPFTRVDRRGLEGHGLGLSIVQRIAEKLGGEVGVESVVGEGSRFTFTLPTAEEKSLIPEGGSPGLPDPAS